MTSPQISDVTTTTELDALLESTQGAYRDTARAVLAAARLSLLDAAEMERLRVGWETAFRLGVAHQKRADETEEQLAEARAALAAARAGGSRTGVDRETLARKVFYADPPMNPHGPNSDLTFEMEYVSSHRARAYKIADALLPDITAQPITSTPVGAGAVGQAAWALHDLLTMLNVNPDERPEHGGDTTAEVLARAALNAARTGESAARVTGTHRTPNERGER